MTNFIPDYTMEAKFPNRMPGTEIVFNILKTFMEQFPEGTVMMWRIIHKKLFTVVACPEEQMDALIADIERLEEGIADGLPFIQEFCNTPVMRDNAVKVAQRFLETFPPNFGMEFFCKGFHFMMASQTVMKVVKAKG